VQEDRSPAPSPVVVGFDGSPDARRAAAWAAALARARGGRALHLVHALALPAIPHHGYDHLSVGELLGRHEREMRERLEAERDLLAAEGLPVEIHLRRWLPVETLIEHAQSQGAGLVVVGRHGSGASHLVLGSVSAAVARRAPVPVVVVRGETRPSPPRLVLAALDGSAPARAAVAALAEWAPTAEVLAVRVREAAADGAGIDEEDVVRDLAGAGLDRLRRRIRIVSGPVAESLLALARGEGADLITAGRRGQSAWEDLLTGSVSDKLLQLAPCPVLLAH